MTAIFGATYPGGLVVASDTYREHIRPLQSNAQIYDADKILALPRMLVGSAGFTTLKNPKFGELLSVNKMVASAVFTQAIKKESDPHASEQLVSDCVRLFSRFNKNVGVEVLIGIAAKTPRFLAVSSSEKNSEHVLDDHCCAIGEAKAYLWQFNCPELLPSSFGERVKGISPSPAFKNSCSSAQEAEAWAREVVQWTCELVPENCGGEVRCWHALNSDTR
jgi:hypothetical protein